MSAIDAVDGSSTGACWGSPSILVASTATIPTALTRAKFADAYRQYKSQVPRYGWPWHGIDHHRK
jgi:protein-S-isoprenylcysteine O-methyltransferase Ste14